MITFMDALNLHHLDTCSRSDNGDCWEESAALRRGCEFVAMNWIPDRLLDVQRR